MDTIIKSQTKKGLIGILVAVALITCALPLFGGSSVAETNSNELVVDSSQTSAGNPSSDSVGIMYAPGQNIVIKLDKTDVTATTVSSGEFFLMPVSKNVFRDTGLSYTGTLDPAVDKAMVMGTDYTCTYDSERNALVVTLKNLDVFKSGIRFDDANHDYITVWADYTMMIAIAPSNYVSAITWYQFTLDMSAFEYEVTGTISSGSAASVNAHIASKDGSTFNLPNAHVYIIAHYQDGKFISAYLPANLVNGSMDLSGLGFSSTNLIEVNVQVIQGVPDDEPTKNYGEAIFTVA